jgi:hypothetical protein
MSIVLRKFVTMINPLKPNGNYMYQLFCGQYLIISYLWIL